MKKLLLSFSLVALGAWSANAQSCTPGANFGDSTYGVWCDCIDTYEGNPVDTITNFPNGTVGVFYSEDMNFKVPAQVTPDIDPNYAGSPINYFTVTNVGGLPPGMNYGCNIGNCTYNGGDNGCANLYGTPTTAGQYDVIIYVTGNITVELIPGFPIDVDQDIEFDGYRVTIDPTAGIFELISPNFLVYPNPASEQLTLAGLEGLQIESVSVTSMSGQVVLNDPNVNSTDHSMNVQNLENGVYFVQVNYEGGSETLKFIKE